MTHASLHLKRIEEEEEEEEEEWAVGLGVEVECTRTAEIQMARIRPGSTGEAC